MAIDQEYIAELSRRTDIVELVGSYVQLKRAGRMEKGLCPFHNEKTPSFYVYPDTSSFYCFGCGAGGDAITFIKEIQNLDYVEAIKFLAARAGMPMPDEDDSATKLRGRVLAINRETARFYVEKLNSPEGRGARGYLRGRALTDSTIRRFGLGYAPNEFGALLKHLKQMGFSEDELLTAGVCKTSAKGTVYDAFRDRAMFPIIDLRGNVIAFGGRRMGEDGGPKYLNSSDTPVFKKSRNLFALNRAKKSTSKRFILAEGYMDVISLHQAGFDTAVATLGTALTAEQAKLMSDYAEQLVICYDADEAGQKATARAIEILKSTPLKVNVLTVTDAKDPDEFIQKFGADRFEQLLSGSRNTVEYALLKVRKKHDLTTADGRVAYIREAIDVLAKEANPTEQDIYAGRIAEETDTAKERVLAQLDSVLRQRRRRATREREKRMLDEGAGASINVSVGGRALGVAYSEQQLVAAMLKKPDETIPKVKKSLRPEQFLTPEMAETYTLLLRKYEDGEHIELSSFSGDLPSKTIALLSRVLANSYDTGFSDEDVEMHIKKIADAAINVDIAAMGPEELRAYIEAKRERKEDI